jgi:hypothetical protein
VTTLGFEPLEVWARHATAILARMEAFARVRRDRACGLVSVQHATPASESIVVGTYEEIAELLRQSNHVDVAAALERVRRAPSRSHAIAVMHDMTYPSVLLEVPR